jgi:two-component system, LytTR family, response regulator LytT
MKVVIIEDEALAAERLEELLIEINPDINVSARIGSVSEAAAWLSLNKPDLIFLDIQLSDGLSFSIFEEVTTEAPIIFTTAYDQYAIKAFKLNSIDYLLKPVRKNELQESLKKYNKFKPAASFDFEDLIRQMHSHDKYYKKRFLVQYGSKIKKVETDEIAYFYAMSKNVFLVTNNGQTYPVEFTLENLEEVLNEESFFRINRKMIIHYKSIKNMVPYSRSRIKIDLEPQPPKDIDPLVSIERSSEFRKWMDK